jgi:hypothetical protein
MQPGNITDGGAIRWRRQICVRIFQTRKPEISGNRGRDRDGIRPDRVNGDRPPRNYIGKIGLNNSLPTAPASSSKTGPARDQPSLANCLLLTRQLGSARLDCVRVPMAPRLTCRLLCIGTTSPFRAEIFLYPRQRNGPSAGAASAGAIVFCCARHREGARTRTQRNYASMSRLGDGGLY